MSRASYVQNVVPPSKPTQHLLIIVKEYTYKSNNIGVTIAKKISSQKRTIRNIFELILEKSLINVNYVVGVLAGKIISNDMSRVSIRTPFSPKL